MTARSTAATAALALLCASVAAAGARAQDAGRRDAGARTPDAGARDAGVADAGDVDAGPAAAEEPAADLLPEELRPRIRVTVSPESGVVTGDLVTLTLHVDAPEGDEINVPEQSFAPFEVFDDDATEHPPENGRQRYELKLELLALEPGDHEIGPIRLRVVTGDGTLGTVEVDPVSVSVGSVLGNEPDAQPKPPTQPVQVLEEDYTLAWVGGTLGALIVLAILMFLLARWWMRREKPAAPPPPPRPPWEVALEELNELRRTLAARLEAGTIVGWADQLSDTTRVYLGRRYEFDGLESTTDEVLSRMRKKQPRGVDVPELAAMLGDLDLVKFAKASPELDHCEQLLAAAFKLVRGTQPSFGEGAKIPPTQTPPTTPPVATDPPADGAPPPGAGS